MVTASRYLTPEEKAAHLAYWQAARSEPFDPIAPGTPDPSIVPLTDAINALPGICTIQSCAGHRAPERKADGSTIAPGRVWLRASEAVMHRFQERVDELLQSPVIEEASIRYGRGDGQIIEIIFAGDERGQRVASETTILRFLQSCSVDRVG